MPPTGATKNRLRFTEPFLTRSGLQGGPRPLPLDRFVRSDTRGGTRA